MKPLLVKADMITRLSSVMTANSLCRSYSTACSCINFHKFRFHGMADDSLRARASPLNSSRNMGKTSLGRRASSYHANEEGRLPNKAAHDFKSGRPAASVKYAG